jgi:tRNA-Thr(GGU) m(6)t(6)A37 methyltransferase TsaA
MSAPGESDGLRPGETALDFDLADRAEAGLAFIGRIRTPWAARADCPKNIRLARETGRGATALVDPPYRPGLTGLAVGDAVILLYWMHQARRDLIVQRPGHVDGPRGPFALRSPVRPNPVSLAAVRVIALDIAQGRIEIDAADCLDGTPLLDIKPWIASVDAPPPG